MWRKYRDFEPEEHVLIGVDTAAGGGDYCAAQFLSRQKLDVPLVYHSKTMATDMTNELHPMMERIYDTTGKMPTVAYERQGGGTFELERLASLNRLGKFSIFKMPMIGTDTNPEAHKLGWDTNSATRPAMLSQLKEAVDKQLIQIPDKQTIQEMFSFVVVQTSSSWKAQAESGAHDDLVMSLAIAWQLYQITIDPGVEYDLPEHVPVFGKTGY